MRTPGFGGCVGPATASVCLWCATLATRPSTAAVDLAVVASPDPPRAGELMDIEITVTNNGPSDRTDVLLVLDYPAGLGQLFEIWFDGVCPGTACEPGEQVNFTVPTLPAGQGVTFSIPARVVAGTADGTVIPLDVEAFDNALLEASASTEVTVDSGRAFELALLATRDPTTPGGMVEYVLTFGVLGTSAGSPSATLSLPVPPGMSFISASGGGVLVGDVVEWNLGALNPGATGERHVTLEVDRGIDEGSIIVVGAFFEDTLSNAVGYETATRVLADVPLELAVAAAPDPARPGEIIDVELTVANRGTLARTGVVLMLETPEHFFQLFEVWFDGDCPSTACETPERAVFTIGTLPAGGSVSFSVPAIILGGTTNGTVVAFEAEVSDSTDEQTMAAAAVAVSGERELELALVEMRDPVVPGGTIDYVLTFGVLASSGGSPGATLRLPLPAGISLLSASDGGMLAGDVVEWTLGSLNPGATGERHAALQVDPGADEGSIVVAEAFFDDASGNEVRSHTTTRVEADIPLDLIVVAAPDPARPGEIVDLELTVANRGALDRTGVVLRLEIPEHHFQLFEVWFDGDCPSTACEPLERAVFTIGTLPAGAGVSFSVPSVVLGTTPGGTVVSFKADVTDSTGIVRESGASVAIDGGRELELALLETRDPVTAGERIEYVVTFGVRAGSPGSPNAMLRLPVPAGTSFVSASDGATLAGDVVQWSLGSLNAGAIGERRAVVEVDGGVAAGSIIVAEASFDDSASNEVRAQTGTRVEDEIALELAVIASPDPARTGEILDVELTVTNTSSLDRSGVVLTLEIPDHMSQLFHIWFDGLCPGTACETLERAVFTIGTLPAGEGVTFSVPAIITGATPNGTVVSFEADVTDSTGQQREGGASISVSSARELELALVEAHEPVQPGETLSYALTYGVLLTSGGSPGATLSFRVPAGTTFIAASGNGTLSGDTVGWALGSLNAAGGIEQTVTVQVDGGVPFGTLLAAEAQFRDLSLPANDVRFQATTRVESASPLDLEVIAAPNPASAGRVLNLDLSVTNTTGFDRSGVVLLLEFPNDIAQLFEASFDGDCPSTACEPQERAVFSIPILGPGETVTFFVPAQVLNATVPGTVIEFDALASDSTDFVAVDGDAFMVARDGDVNGDGRVNVTDLVEVVLDWGPCLGCPTDLNGDGVVNVADLVEVVLNWT